MAQFGLKTHFSRLVIFYTLRLCVNLFLLNVEIMQDAMSNVFKAW